MEQFQEYFLGGLDDMAFWSTNIYHLTSFMLENGTRWVITFSLIPCLATSGPNITHRFSSWSNKGVKESLRKEKNGNCHLRTPTSSHPDRCVDVSPVLRDGEVDHAKFMFCRGPAVFWERWHRWERICFHGSPASISFGRTGTVGWGTYSLQVPAMDVAILFSIPTDLSKFNSS